MIAGNMKNTLRTWLEGYIGISVMYADFQTVFMGWHCFLHWPCSLFIADTICDYKACCTTCNTVLSE